MHLGTTVSVTFRLALAGRQEAIAVEPSTSAIDTRQTTVARVITGRQIAALPINVRNFISFALVTPGALADALPSRGPDAASGLSIDGQRGRSNNVMVDGLSNNDPATNAVRATFGQDAVREFQVVTNWYSAELGDATGGIVNIVTRSGTNALAGGAFFFGRSQALDAREYFDRVTPGGTPIDRPKPRFFQNQFGATAGGPVRRDRTFFFASYERLDLQGHSFVTIDDTTQVPNPFGGAPLGTPAGILRKAGFAVDTGEVPTRTMTDEFLAKVDQHVSSRQTLAVRFNYGGTYDESISTMGGIVARSKGTALDAADYDVAASHTLVGGARFVNEIRGQAARRDQNVVGLDPACGGPCTGDLEGGPTLDVLGVASVGRQELSPQPRNLRLLELADTATYDTGAHQLKAGADINRASYVDTRLPFNFGGRYVFAAMPATPGLLPAPISSIQAVALGIPAGYVRGTGNPDSSYNVARVSAFVQDDWRARPNLTVKLGVRYQHQIWPDLRFNVPRVGAYAFPRDPQKFGPRVAVAWQPLPGRRVSVRAAYGLYYDDQMTGISGVAKAISGGAAVRTYVANLPATIAAWRTPGHDAPAPATPFPSLVVSIDPRLKAPYAQQFSTGVDAEWRGLRWSAFFVHVRGNHLLAQLDYNPLVPSLGPGRRPGDVNGIAGTSTGQNQYTSFGRTWYDGATVSVVNRWSGRLQFRASYTRSRAEDNSIDVLLGVQDPGRGRNPADPSGPPLGFDPMGDKGLSGNDRPDRFVFGGTFVLPAQVECSSIVSAGSGSPYTMLAGSDLNGNGDATTDRARRDPASEASSVGRNTGRLPAQATVDVRVSRRFGLTRRIGVDVMLDVFNLLNRANFTAANNVWGPGAYPDHPLPSFGQLTAAGPPREIQLGARLVF